MSSTAEISQDSIQTGQSPKSKRDIIRRRLIIFGALLFIFGLLLPFIAEAYYNYGYKLLPSFRNSYSKTLDAQAPQSSKILNKESGRQIGKTVSSVNFDAAQNINLKSAAFVIPIFAGGAKPPLQQPRLKIRGIVKSRDGRALDGVKVVLLRANKIVGTDTTDSSGEYSFANLSPGDYEISARTKTQRKSAFISLSVEQSNSVEIVFEPQVKPTPKPTSSRTPTPTPVPPTPTPIPPTPTPTLIPTPTIKGATPTPTNSPTPSPTVSPTANTGGNQTSTPNTSDANETKYDKIDVSYPQRIFQDKTQEISFTLEHWNESISPWSRLFPDSEANTQTNRITNTRTIGQTITNLCRAAGCKVKAKPRLVLAGGLELAPDSVEPEWKIYDGSLLTWDWKVKTTLEDGAEALFRIELDFELQYEKKTEPLPDYWRDSPQFSILVGLPKVIKIMSPVSLALGFLGILGGFVGVVPGMRRKEDEDAQTGGEIPKDAAEPPILGTVEQAADEVHCALYAPTEVAAGSTLAIQVFAHLAGQAEALDELARELDPEAKKRKAEKLKKKIERGAELTFKLMIPGLELSETEQTSQWEGEPVGVQFFVPVPDTHLSGSRFGRVTVFENGEKIGMMPFGVKILASGQQPSQENTVTPIVKFDSAFISYASEDKDEVYEFLQLLDALEVTYHVDVMSIAPGDRWEQKLYEFIDADDVFLLFWSEAASRSEWVLKEAERANTRRGADGKNPPKIIIHQLVPPEVRLPAWLGYIQLDRKWADIIENARRKKEERQRRIENNET